MSMFNENLVKNLPDAFKKTTDSNNYKILEIERISCETLRERLRDIEEILNIDNAKGKTLDLYGERVKQYRGIATDDKYILMIKAKIMRNLTNGTYESIVNALCTTFNCEPSQVYITDGDEPCTINISALPLEVINRAGLTTAQTTAIIKAMLPVGVSVTSFLYEGTFEFSNIENEYDESKGFSDVEGGTIGGYFGVTQGDEQDIILPI